jgi:hypothetical protein
MFLCRSNSQTSDRHFPCHIICRGAPFVPNPTAGNLPNRRSEARIERWRQSAPGRTRLSPAIQDNRPSQWQVASGHFGENPGRNAAYKSALDQIERHRQSSVSEFLRAGDKASKTYPRLPVQEVDTVERSHGAGSGGDVSASRSCPQTIQNRDIRD